ncbi:MAG: tRNA uridine-5-carboxymethylaminomethyl(34) synthesis GTPase MnmE [Desulfuromusa sp.]|jgi:tRNA modification GTPase|nr:tRNA uridine-5-carboxymethylaminomethyl(34) synthesis GTPase MnmE [Desulfuromusa sp.]
MNTTDTIIAPATAPGEGGIAIVRISGADAQAALLHYFQPSAKVTELESHHLYHGTLRDNTGCVIDEVMAVYMAAPHTYTRDDVVEIQCHGSQQVVKSIISLYLSHGIRLAEPGEFTYRAYMSGRLDLSQAEAVSSLIHAKTDSSRKLALMQVDGVLSREIYLFAAALKQVLVLVEAWIDFPEEDLPAEDLRKITTTIARVNSEILTITASYDCGRVLSEGASILLVGQPNAGKSSLLNALLGEERAIVTAVPGTTRDLLEEGLTINGVPVCLVDTAGLRESEDVVEVEGIRRAENKLSLADLVLLVVDASREIDEQDRYVLGRCVGTPTFLVFTKKDIKADAVVASFSDFPTYEVSAKTEEGLDQLRDGISTFLVGDYLSSSESVMLTERRHHEALLFCLDGLGRATDSLAGDTSLELLAFDLREVLYHLGQISGETTTESLLDDIFSGFCIGK